ncbi:unnamed protein product [Cylicocyclus nassatus]|uniref:rRNA methyltransferase 1, mitochondrial n=1 Tax=Cylicocyclus nassatus TaxID=53992 RepID=A0AA36GTH5_CYLNA|nr:unnamed protein product [Cylicocyclus nassatus]
MEENKNMNVLPTLRPTLSRRTLYGTSNGSSTPTNRPNLIYRKAKVTGKSLEELRSSNVPVPKFRGEAVFGVYPVLEALANETRDFFGLYIKDSVRSRCNHDERISKILEHARVLGLPVRRLTHSQFDKITDFQLHNGICLDASPLRFGHDVDDTQLTSLYLDNVLDPGNLGAIARSAMFFGCNQIVCSEGRGPSKITPAMSKASCGALECFRVTRVPSFTSFYEILKRAGALFIGTSDAVSARKFGKPAIELEALEVEKEQELVLVLGDEGSGVSNEVMTNCDVLLTITSPSMRKTSINSLNVSVVAGILLHHIATVRQK